MIPNINIKDFDFQYPQSLIANYPNPNRDQAKLLVYNHNNINDHVFTQLPDLLPLNSLLLFNQTKVIPARLFFQKQTGAIIEILLIKPIDKSQNCWKCIIGNRSKFKQKDKITHVNNPNFLATWYNQAQDIICFHSTHNKPIMDLIMEFGSIPLPPYIKRKAEPQDSHTYQTVFAKQLGAVAAPTASLHFTNSVISQILDKGHKIHYLTLHVGLGTFAPVKTKYIHDHEMHSEEFFIDFDVINEILSHKGPVIPVGTTSMRVLESIPVIAFQHAINQNNQSVALTDSAFQKEFRQFSKEQIVKTWENIQGASDQNTFYGNTKLLIAPSYPIKLTSALITNFHQPKSTLLLLIAALVGSKWRSIYTHAIQNQYQLFSYGDSSLIMP